MGREALAAMEDVTRCPRAARCNGCDGTEGLEIAAITTVIGVLCVTICRPCVEANRLKHLSYRQGVQLVLAHCQHLGVTADAMTDALREARR